MHGDVALAGSQSRDSPKLPVQTGTLLLVFSAFPNLHISQNLQKFLANMKASSPRPQRPYLGEALRLAGGMMRTGQVG